MEPEKYTRKGLIDDLDKVVEIAFAKKCYFTPMDCCLLGYLAGKHGLAQFVENEEELIKVCVEYDKTDDLKIDEPLRHALERLGIVKKELEIINN
jgi:hypothetical protein